MRVSRKHVSRFTLLAVTIAGWISGTSREVQAQYYWDPNHTLTSTAGGSGYWDENTANWFDPISGQDIALQGSRPPYFAGAGGVVTVALLRSEQVEFDSGGYLIKSTTVGNSVSSLYVNWFTQGSTASGVNEISVPIGINDRMTINGGTLNLTNINPQNANIGTGIDVDVASGGTLECLVTPQASALPEFANVNLYGTLQLDLQGSTSTPIRLYNDISLENGSNVVFMGAPKPVEFTSMSGGNSAISGPAGTVLYLDLK